MPDTFDAIIIGTGFGATVAASALRAKKKRVLMLERGLWYFTPERPIPQYVQDTKQPKEFWPRPDHRDGLLDLLAMAKTNLEPSWLQKLSHWAHHALSNEPERQPLYRYNVFPQVDILTASGVGGGSLIYSNVSIEPYYDGTSYPVMENWPEPLKPLHYVAARQWMTDFRGPAHKVVTKFPLPKQFRETMRANPGGPLPGDPPFSVDKLPPTYDSLYLSKSFALKYAAENMTGPWKAKMDPAGWEGLNLQVNEPEDDLSQYDYANKPICERQGRCLLGCLPAARHTLNKTLLKQLNLSATDPTFQVRPLSEVDYIRALPNGAGYEVNYHNVNDGTQSRVTAPQVILAAGCLGSAEIMLRSASKGLQVSNKIGSQFSCNGDFAGFAVNIAPTVKVNGADKADPVWPAYATRGPINTVHVPFRDGKLQINVEDCTIPAMLAPGVRLALDVLDKGTSHPLFGKLSGIWTGRALSDLVPLIPDPDKATSFETEAEMLMDVFFFNTQGTDTARGQFGLDDDERLTLNFPKDALAHDPVLQKSEEIMKAMAQAMGSPNAEQAMWRMVPDLDVLDQLLASEQFDKITITFRGIGEMAGDKNATNANAGTSWMDLSPFESDEFGIRRAYVNLVATARDKAFWDTMDQAAIQLAQALAGSPANIEYFYDGVWNAAPPPLGKVRDGLGTTHHEAGTLWMGTDPNTSVVNLDGRFHNIQNAYAAGPAVFPALGSANPSLTALTLARRTAAAITSKANPAPASGAVSLITPSLAGWQMAGSGPFNVIGDDTIESQGGIGLLWYTKDEFADFTLSVQWRSINVFDNSGVFIRFPVLGNTNPAEDWKLAVDQGYEIQIDDRGYDPNTNTTGSPLQMTGAIYQLAAASKLASKPLGQWNTFEIEAIGPDIKVKLNGQPVSHLTNPQGRPLKGHIGLQNHHPGSRVQFRNLFVKKVGAAVAAGRAR